MSVEPLKFDMPKFEFPKFDIPKMEVPAAFRDLAEKSIAQCKTGYEKMKSAAEETTNVLEDTYAKASKGTTEYNLKLIEAARHNTNAAFDFASELMSAKSMSDMVELSTAHARKQFEAAHRPGQGIDRADPEGCLPRRPSRSRKASARCSSRRPEAPVWFAFVSSVRVA